MSKKRAINPKTREKVSTMLHMVQKELNADTTYPIYKIPKVYQLNTYYTQAMRDMKIIERFKEGHHRMKILTITEKIVDDLIRCANKKATSNARKYNLRKKEEKEAQETIRRESVPHVNEIVEKKQEVFAKIEEKKEEKVAKSFEEIMYGNEAHDMAELKRQLKKANEFLLEAKSIIEKRDEEIAKLKAYVSHMQKKEMDMVYEMVNSNVSSEL